MFVSLPLFEKGDGIIAVQRDEKAASSNFWVPIIALKLTVSEVLSDSIVSTCGKKILKTHVIEIFKKYGIRVKNPFFKGFI